MLKFVKGDFLLVIRDIMLSSYFVVIALRQSLYLVFAGGIFTVLATIFSHGTLKILQIEGKEIIRLSL